MDLGEQNLRAEQKGLSELWVKNTNSNASGKEDYIPLIMTVFIVGRFMAFTSDRCNFFYFACHSEQQQKQWNYYANQSVLVDQIPDISTSSVWNFGGRISDVSSVKCL